MTYSEPGGYTEHNVIYGEGMEMEQDKTGRSKMLRLLLLFLIPGIIIQKTWKSSKNAEGYELHVFS